MELVIDTKIEVKELYEFTLNHNYKSLHGIISLLFSLASAVGAVVYWDRFNTMNKVLIILFALMFTVFEPIGCYIKVRKQIKKSFTEPIKYAFSSKGITISQGNNKAVCEWYEIMKVVSTKNLINVYTSPVRAFIIPKKDIKEKLGELETIIRENAQCIKISVR